MQYLVLGSNLWELKAMKIKLQKVESEGKKLARIFSIYDKQ